MNTDNRCEALCTGKAVPDEVGEQALMDQGLGAFWMDVERVMSKSLKWGGLVAGVTAGLVCAGAAMAAGKLVKAEIGADIDTVVDVSASPTLQRWQAGRRYGDPGCA